MFFVFHNPETNIEEKSSPSLTEKKGNQITREKGDQMQVV